MGLIHRTIIKKNGYSKTILNEVVDSCIEEGFIKEYSNDAGTYKLYEITKKGLSRLSVYSRNIDDKIAAFDKIRKDIDNKYKMAIRSIDLLRCSMLAFNDLFDIESLEEVTDGALNPHKTKLYVAEPIISKFMDSFRQNFEKNKYKEAVAIAIAELPFSETWSLFKYIFGKRERGHTIFLEKKGFVDEIYNTTALKLKEFFKFAYPVSYQTFQMRKNSAEYEERLKVEEKDYWVDEALKTEWDEEKNFLLPDITS